MDTICNRTSLWLCVTAVLRLFSGHSPKTMRIGLLLRLVSLHRTPLNAFRVSPSNFYTGIRRSPGTDSLRAFGAIKKVRRDEIPTKGTAESRVQTRAEPPDSLRPETIQQPDETKLSSSGREQKGPRNPLKTDGLLSEQTVSNKEQRKADWAIIREMSTYLWPKVQAKGTHLMRFTLTFIERYWSTGESCYCNQPAHWFQGQACCIFPCR